MAFKKGHKINVGRIPWNKGIYGYHTSWKGQNHSKKTLEKMSKSLKGKISWNEGLTKYDHPALMKVSESQKESKNPMWKGNNVGYNALHEWVRTKLPQSELCESCNKVPPYDLANISGEYKRDLNDWKWLCRKCHMIEDGRLKRDENGRFILLGVQCKT